VSKYLAGAGWYEFLHKGNSYTVRLWEDGSHHMPHPKVTINDFIAALERGEAWKLIRTDPLVEVRPNLRLVTNEM
jgi:hypothetical protein